MDTTTVRLVGAMTEIAFALEEHHWEVQCEHDDNWHEEFAAQYPFHLSFDELVSEMIQWHNHLKTLVNQ